MVSKRYLLLILFGLFSFFLFGQNNSSIYQAFISGDMDKWKHSMNSLEAIKNRTNKENLDLINFQYGYIAWCIEKDKTDAARNYIEKSEELIKQLENKKYELSMLYAYKAAIIGYKISISPLKAPFIGSQSLTYAKQSVSLDPYNYFGYIQLGNVTFNVPKMFGGSKTEAMQHYLKALGLMENNQEIIKQNWIYLSLLATIIEAYIDIGKYEKAKEYCLKTLSVEPKFDWIKNRLCLQVL